MARPIRMTKAEWQRIVNNTRSDQPEVQEKRKLEQHEEEEQMKLFRLIKVAAPGVPELYSVFAVANGADRHPAVAGKLKAGGVLAGVWDIHTPLQRQGYTGLWIEMKWGKNWLSAEQQAWATIVGEAGARLEVCYDALAAFDVLCDYFDITLPDVDDYMPRPGPSLWDQIEPGGQLEL